MGETAQVPFPKTETFLVRVEFTTEQLEELQRQGIFFEVLDRATEITKVARLADLEERLARRTEKEIEL